jgi:hypothetical protein
MVWLKLRRQQVHRRAGVNDDSSHRILEQPSSTGLVGASNGFSHTIAHASNSDRLPDRVAHGTADDVWLLLRGIATADTRRCFAVPGK